MQPSTENLPMRRALYLAGLAQGNTYPNPVVGSVIMQYGKVLGEGYHQRAGEPHAEINALSAVPESSRLDHDTELFVTLEPCAHWGRTGPCAVAIAEQHIPTVIVGTLDSNTQVNGKGVQILQDAGIQVFNSDLSVESLEINRRFFTFQEKKRPYVILKWAESEDGFLDCKGQPTAISNALTGQFVHTLRAREDAILIGKNTALHDNPSLTTRNIFGRNPRRIVLDRKLEIPTDLKLFGPDSEVFILNQIQEKTDNNLHYLMMENDGSAEDVLSALYRLGIQSILIEGGRHVLQNFLEASLWDELYQITATGVFLEEGTGAPAFSAESQQQWYFRNDRVQHYINT